jgi:hypothetical protein
MAEVLSGDSDRDQADAAYMRNANNYSQTTTSGGLARNNLIHRSFPSQGTPQGSHMGSQSQAPTKEY